MVTLSMCGKPAKYMQEYETSEISSIWIYVCEEHNNRGDEPISINSEEKCSIGIGYDVNH